MQLASLYEQNGKFEDAKKLYEKILERNDNIDPAINNLASLLTDQFRSEDNLKKAELLAERFKDSSEPYYLDTYGWVKVQLGNLDEAELILSKVVSLVPDVAIFNYHLGVLFVKKNNHVEAEKYLNEAKELAIKQNDQNLVRKINNLLAGHQ